MTKGSNVYAVGKVATILDVSRGTVIRWVEEGKLSAFKLPSGHIRIKKTVIIDFLKQYNMPIPSELKNKIQKIMVLTGDKEMLPFINRSLKNFPEYVFETMVMDDHINASFTLGISKPDIFMLDLRIKNCCSEDLIRDISMMKEWDNMMVLLFSGYDEEVETGNYARGGVVLTKPWSSKQLKKQLDAHLYD